MTSPVATLVEPSKSELGAEQILDLLSKEPESDKESKEEVETLDLSDEKEEKEDKSEDEDEIKLKEVDEDEIEEISTPARRKDILAKYPDLYKDFPHLEKATYREKEYTELFGTIDDARELVEKTEIFNDYESALLEGNTESVLRAIKDSGDDAFSHLVDEYLPTLAKVDQSSYVHVVTELLKQGITTAAAEGTRTNNEQLKQAAQVFSQFFLGTSEHQAPRKLSREDNSEADKLKAEREEFMEERFNEAKSSLDKRIFNTLRATVNEHMDPKGQMSPFVKKHAVIDAMENLNELITQDDQFMIVLDGLWYKSKKAKFSQSSIDKIKGIFLSRAKTLLKPVINKSKREALKGLSKTLVTKEEKVDSQPRRARIPKNETSNKGRGMSTVDYFDQQLGG